MMSSWLLHFTKYVFILQLLHRKNQSESVLESPDMTPQKRDPAQLYLASNSPRRRELLSLIGFQYTLLPSQVDETPLPDEDGMQYVKRIAKSKALIAATQNDDDGIIIAADTAVINHMQNGKTEIFGKPVDLGDAAHILQRLRGHAHQVLTALTILRTRDDTILVDCCLTDVPMRNYGNEEIEAYIASGDPMDKAGAYAIQHAGFHPVEKMEGCYANVMGLPLCHLTRCLIQLAIAPKTDVPRVCQAALGYNCPIYSQILEGKT
jgi:nucleoside triphosphate pyrophosphatase